MNKFDKILEYNSRDILLTNRLHEKTVLWYMMEYMPRYGSAWENMMLYDLSIPHYKGEKI